MDSEAMRTRTKQFALRVMKMINSLPKTTLGKVLADQLMRSAESVGASYRSALRGRSRKEFIAKVGICLEECDESLFWLEFIEEGDLLPATRLQDLKKKPTNSARSSSPFSDLPARMINPNS